MKKPTNTIAPDAKIGKNVRIWHYAYVGSKTVIGDNVKIGSLAHVDYDVVIGSGTKIEGSVYIPPMSRIGKNVFFGPAVVLTNDPYPPSKRMIGVTIEDDAVICARAVIKAGVRIGKRAVVAMGAVVTKDVPSGKVVMGIPARTVYTRKEFDVKMKKWESGS
jgi:acetyltransferase-like isoleucine patch superfamily enzyme